MYLFVLCKDSLKLSSIRTIFRGLSGSNSTAPRYTADVHTNLSRNAYFGVVGDKVISQFESLLNTSGYREAVLTDPEDIQPFNIDWTRKFRGNCRTFFYIVSF
ncbi:unnamed protein product [Protopolystoma xenopodis]|uniref:Uncharacterized protein n=1 Tax=Protopolystoma xenopodis TaxID=117903 RepID=A0A448WXG9_9PLAT|nr:unnamed protein product [Protopolystoma xenopodis]